MSKGLKESRRTTSDVTEIINKEKEITEGSGIPNLHRLFQKT